MSSASMHKFAMLWRQMAGYRVRYAAAVAALAVAGVFTFAVPVVAGFVVDHALGDRAPAGLWARWGVTGDWLRDRLWLAGVLIVALTAAAGFFTRLQGVWSSRASESIARRLRDVLYDRLQRLTCRYHDQLATGDTVQRCTSDVETVRAFLATQVIQIAQACANLLVALPVLFYMNWRLALWSTALLPVIVAFAVIFFHRVQATFKAMDEAEGALTARIQENLTNVRVVRAFARQAFEQEKFDARNEDHRVKHWKLYRVFAVFWSVSDLMVFVQMGAALFAGAWFVASGRIPVGELVTFWMVVGILVWPVRQMGPTLSELGKALVALQRVDEVLSAPVEQDPAEPCPDLPPRLAGRIAFEDVRFGHKDDQPVLHGVSFTVEPGKILAILGPSGCGKTTIVNLLLRFYDPDGGRITIDGLDLARLPRRYVRGQVGVVMQEPFLYSRTLRDNLTLGRHHASDQELAHVVQAAALHESIERFEDGYATLVGERGVTLSGGQRQRVAIARALLQDKPVMVLDDAFSAVDTRTEGLILDALRRRRGRATTLLIAHRLSTLRQADEILVLDRGRIAQRGTHDQLVNADGLYRRLWRVQNALADDLKQEMGV